MSDDCAWTFDGMDGKVHTCGGDAEDHGPSGIRHDFTRATPPPLTRERLIEAATKEIEKAQAEAATSRTFEPLGRAVDVVLRLLVEDAERVEVFYWDDTITSWSDYADRLRSLQAGGQT